MEIEEKLTSILPWLAVSKENNRKCNSIGINATIQTEQAVQGH